MTTKLKSLWMLAIVGLLATTSLPVIRAEDPAPIRQVFVPAAQLNAVLRADKFSALMSREEFDALVAKARLAGVGSENEQRAPVIGTATLRARPEAEQLLADATAAVTTWKRNTEVDLKVAGWNVIAVRLGDQPARCTRVGDGFDTLRVFIPAAGTHEIKLQLSANLRSAGSDQLVTIGALGAATELLELALPAGKFLDVNGAAVPREGANDQPVTYKVPLGGRASAALSITDRRQGARQDRLTFANTAYGVQVEPGSVTWTALTRIEVFGQPINRLTCTVPGTLEITGVESNGLESWELSDDPAEPQRTVIRLAYRQPFDGARTITFRGVVTVAGNDAWTVPALRIADVNSHTGKVILNHPANLRLQSVEASGARIAATANAATARTSQTYEVWQDNFVLRFLTTLKEQVVTAATTAVVDAHLGGVDLSITITWQTRQAPLFDARVRLPADYQVISASVDGVQVSPDTVPDAAGINEIRVPFATPLLPGQTRKVTLVAQLEPEGWPVGAAPLVLQLPEVRLPQAETVELLLGVAAASDLDVAPLSLTGLEPARRSDLDILKSISTMSGEPTRLGFTAQEAGYSGQLQFSRRPMILTARTLTFFRIGHEDVFTRLETTLESAGGGIRTLNVDVSESAGDSLRFTLSRADGSAAPARIVQQSPAAPVNGLRTYRLEFDRYLQGKYVLFTEARSPRAGGSTFQAPRLQFPQAEASSGFIAVESAPDLNMSIKATEAGGAALPLVDPVDFPAGRYRPRERVVSGYSYVQPGWTVEVTATSLNREAIPTAISQKSELVSVVGQQGETQHAASIHFIAVGAQSLLVKLPEGARLWSTLLDGVPIEARKTAAGVHLPLGQVRSSNSRQLQITYSTQQAPLADQGELKLLPPQLFVVTGAGAEQPLEVLQQDWRVYTPHETEVSSVRGNFRAVQPLGRWTLISDLRHSLSLPTKNELSDAVLMLFVATAILFLCAVGVRAVRQGHVLLGSTRGIIGAAAVVVFGMAVLYWGLPGTLKMEVSNSSREWTSGPVGAFDGSKDESNGYVEDRFSRARPYGSVNPEQKPGSDAYRAGDRDNLGLGRRSGSELIDNSRSMQPGLAGVPESAAGPVPNAAPASQPMPNQSPNNNQPPLQGMYARPFDNAQWDFNTNGVVDPPAPPARQPMGIGVAPQPEVPTSNGVTITQATPRDRWQGEVVGLLGDNQSLARPGAMVGGPGPGVMRLGLLSMAVPLQIPQNSSSDTFQSMATGATAEDLALTLTYSSQSHDRALLALITFGAALIGWFLRKASPSLRVMWLVLTIVLPLATMWLVEPAWERPLEGLLFGGILTVLGWIIAAIGNGLTKHRLSTSTNVPPAATAVAVVALLTLLSPSNAHAQAAPEPPAQPYVVIPYRSIDQINNADKVWVPTALYQKLWQAAHPDEGPQPAGSVPQMIAESTYAVELKPDAKSGLSLQARWVMVLLQDAPGPVALPLRGMGLTNVTLNGQPAPLVSDANGGLSVQLPARGVHIVDASAEIPAEINRQVGSFSLQLVPTGSGVLTFKLPASQDKLRVRVNGGTGSFRRIGEERIEVPIDRGGKFTINWQPEQQQRDDANLVQLETQINATVNDTGIFYRHEYLARVRQGGITELDFTLPEGPSVQRISGADVAGWEIAGEAGMRKLKLSFRRQVTDETRFVFELADPRTSGEAAQEFDVPDVRAQSVSRESGVITLRAVPSLRVSVKESASIQQVERAANQASPAGQEIVATYRYADRPFKLLLQANRRESELRVTAEHGAFVQTRRVRLASRIVVTLGEAAQRRLEILIPADYTPVDVVCPFAVDWYVTETAPRALVIELDQPRTGEIEIGLEGQTPKVPETPTATVAVPRIAQAVRSTTQLGVWFDDIYRASLSQSGEWRSVSPSELPPRIASLQPTPLQFAFRSTGSAETPLQFTTQRATADLSADTAVLIAMGDTTIDYGLTLRWKVSNAAADRFSFTVPTWLGRLELTAPGIRQAFPRDLGDGRTRWTISLIEPVRDQFLCTAAATIPLPADLLVKTPSIDMESMTPAEVSQSLTVQRHFAVLVNLSAYQLSAVDPAQVESLPADQLSLTLPAELVQQAMEIARVRADRIPVWRAVRSSTGVGARAVVLSANLLTVLERNGEWRTLATYAIRNRGQQFIGVRIPSGARILSVFVRNAASRTVTTTINGQPQHLVALPQTSSADLSFDVQLLVAGRLVEPLTTSNWYTSKQITLPSPEILTQQESTEFGIPVAQSLWKVFVPDELQATPLLRGTGSNVTWHQGNVAMEAQRQLTDRLRSDLEEMSRIAKDKTVSEEQRAQSRSNLKELNLRINQLPDSQLQSDAIDALKKANETDAEQAKKGQALDSKSFLNNRSYILSNNGDLLMSNSVGGKAAEEFKSDFNFFDANDSRRAGQKLEAEEGQGSNRALLKSQIREQQSAPRADGPAGGNAVGGFQGGQNAGGQRGRGGRGGGGGGGARGNQGQQPGEQQGLGQQFGLEAQQRQRFDQPQMVPPPQSPQSGERGGGRGGFDGDGILNSVETGRMRWFQDEAEAIQGPIFGIQQDGAPGTNGRAFLERTEQAAEGQSSGGQSTPGWSAGGGLSVAMNIPVAGHELAFSKVGGNPQVTLSVCPAVFWNHLLAAGWGILVIAAAYSAFRPSRHENVLVRLIRAGALLAILVGLAGTLFFMDDDLRFFSLILFCFGGATLGLLWALPVRQPMR